MRPAFADDVAAQGSRPRYNLQLWIDPATGTLNGTQQIVLTNRTSDPLQDIVLRLYPNFPPDVFGTGGNTSLRVTDASIDSQPVAGVALAQNTALQLPLVAPLNPGATATLALTFTATFVPWADGAWPLASYYPMLAVYDASGWRTDLTQFADHVYAETAFYQAQITIPSSLGLIATGSTINTYAHSNGSTTYTIVSGPVREFAFSVGDFVSETRSAGLNDDILVHVHRVRGSPLDAAQIVEVASGALTTYEYRFGPYPYRELDIHLLPGQFDGGWEYPGLILLSSDAQVDAGTRYVAAHEVAHQWWYSVVGNDIYRASWLDEAFAQYSAIIYAEDVAGPAVAAADWEREVMQRYRGALNDGDLPIGLAVDAYPDFGVYYRTIYGKGAFFLATLRSELGDEAFFQALQRYYQRQRYEVATNEDVQQAFEDASGRNLDDIFLQWVTGW